MSGSAHPLRLQCSRFLGVCEEKSLTVKLSEPLRASHQESGYRTGYGPRAMRSRPSRVTIPLAKAESWFIRNASTEPVDRSSAASKRPSKPRRSRHRNSRSRSRIWRSRCRNGRSRWTEIRTKLLGLRDAQAAIWTDWRAAYGRYVLTP